MAESESTAEAQEERDYLRPDEVAELFRVDPKTVTRWAKQGKLPFIRTLGGHRRYPRAKILQLIEARRFHEGDVPENTASGAGL